MLTIFIEPDRTEYPYNFQSTVCPGLEAKTGADIVVSFQPPNPLTGLVISPVDSLQSHIDSHSLFGQIKIGYDIIPHDDRLKSSIARMMKEHIPKGQAILLPIGDYYEKDGLLRVRGKKDRSNTPYSTLATIFDMWSMRGGTVDPLPPKSIDDLQAWIDQKQHSIEKITKEGKRDIYPPKPQFLPEDIWQPVEEVSDWRKFLVSGLDKFGSAKANAIWKYAREHYDGSPFGFYPILCMLTDEKNGKPVHNIPLWGDKSRKDFRGQLGIRDGWNLYDAAWEATYFQGWRSCLDQFSYMFNKEKTLSTKKIEDMLNELRKEDEIPF